MSDFGNAAARLAGTCCLAFGWTPAQFWAATPAEVACLVTALAPEGAQGLDAGELARLREALGDG